MKDSLSITGLLSREVTAADNLDATAVVLSPGPRRSTEIVAQRVIAGSNRMQDAVGRARVRRVFALGAITGMAMSLVMIRLLAPAASDSHVPGNGLPPVFGPGVAYRLPITIPSLGFSSLTLKLDALSQTLPAMVVRAELPVPQVHHVAPNVLAVATAAAVVELPSAPKVMKESPEIVSAPAPEPAEVTPGAGSHAFGASTVLYSAGTPAAAPATLQRAAFTVVSVPSSSLALISSEIAGQTMVSPYKIGQALPDGKIIASIDVERGLVSTSGGQTFPVSPATSKL